MPTYAVKGLIEADPQTIWNLLTDAPNYPTWNPAVLGIEGTIAPGERIKSTSDTFEESHWHAVGPDHSVWWAELGDRELRR